MSWRLHKGYLTILLKDLADISLDPLISFDQAQGPKWNLQNILS